MAAIKMNSRHTILQCQVGEYVSSEALSCYIYEMFSPERAGNFILEVTEDDVKELLAQKE